MSCSLALKDQILIPAFLHWLSLCVCPLQTLRTPLIFSEPTVICNPVSRGSLMSCCKYAIFTYHYPSTRGQGKPKFGPYHWEKWEFLFPSSTLGFERPRCLIHNHWSVITIIGLRITRNRPVHTFIYDHQHQKSVPNYKTSTASDQYQHQFIELLMTEMYTGTRSSRSAVSSYIWCLSNYKSERLVPHVSVWGRDCSRSSIHGQKPEMGIWTFLLLVFSSPALRSKAKSCAYYPVQTLVKWLILSYSRFKYGWCRWSIVWSPRMVPR